MIRPMERARAQDRQHQLRRRRGRGDRGVALLEFAIIAPFLFLVVFGVIDFGWTFYQHLDVRHGARETGRLVAVADAANTTALMTEACTRMDPDADTDIGLQFPNGTDIGDEALVTVTRQIDGLTGAMDLFLPDEVSSTVRFRLEQDASQLSPVAPGGSMECT